MLGTLAHGSRRAVSPFLATCLSLTAERPARPDAVPMEPNKPRNRFAASVDAHATSLALIGWHLVRVRFSVLDVIR